MSPWFLPAVKQGLFVKGITNASLTATAGWVQLPALLLWWQCLLSVLFEEIPCICAMGEGMCCPEAAQWGQCVFVCTCSSAGRAAVSQRLWSLNLLSVLFSCWFLPPSWNKHLHMYKPWERKQSLYLNPLVLSQELPAHTILGHLLQEMRLSGCPFQADVS